MDDIGVDAFGRTIVGNDTTEDNSDSRRHREYDRNSRDRDRDRELAEPRVNYPRDSYYNSRAGYSNGGENNNSEYNRIRRGDGGGFVGQKRGRDEFSSQHHRSGRGGGDWGVQGRGNRGRGERGFRDGNISLSIL